MQSFYKGVNPSIRVNIDAAARGTVMLKTLEDALDFLKKWLTHRAFGLMREPSQRKEVQLKLMF